MNSISITNSAHKRQSNIELLRLFSMFLVLLVHANANALGYPDAADAHAYPLITLIRSFIFGLTMVAVNVFVMISGWFSIKPSFRGLAKYCFQVVFILTVAVLISALRVGFHGSMILECFALMNNCWFAVAYLGLYLSAPILNAFVEKAGKRLLGITVVGLVIYAALYGMMYSGAYLNGYSAFNFMIIYLVGRYVKLYGSANWGGLWIWFGCTLLGTAVFYTMLWLRVPTYSPGIWLYCNPLLIVSAIALVTKFNSLKIRYSPTINRLAASCFAVYLFQHGEIWMRQYFDSTILSWWQTESIPLFLWHTLLFVMAFYAAGILLDQPRKWLWQAIDRHFFHCNKAIIRVQPAK